MKKNKIITNTIIKFIFEQDSSVSDIESTEKEMQQVIKSKEDEIKIQNGNLNAGKFDGDPKVNDLKKRAERASLDSNKKDLDLAKKSLDNIKSIKKAEEELKAKQNTKSTTSDSVLGGNITGMN